MSILNFLSPTLGENPGDYNRRDFKGNPLTAEEIYEAFTEWISTRGMTLYPRPGRGRSEHCSRPQRGAGNPDRFR